MFLLFKERFFEICHKAINNGADSSYVFITLCIYEFEWIKLIHSFVTFCNTQNLVELFTFSDMS
jgi:hypothetical protein